jgi:hypothetical protein
MWDRSWTRSSRRVTVLRTAAAGSPTDGPDSENPWTAYSYRCEPSRVLRPVGSDGRPVGSAGRVGRLGRSGRPVGSVGSAGRVGAVGFEANGNPGWANSVDVDVSGIVVRNWAAVGSRGREPLMAGLLTAFPDRITQVIALGRKRVPGPDFCPKASGSVEPAVRARPPGLTSPEGTGGRPVR